MMDGLTAFVTARLDEDEAAAKAADAGPWHSRNLGRHDLGSVIRKTGETPISHVPEGPALGTFEGVRGAPNAAHVARHDPARALREVAAKRKRLAAYIAARAAADRYDDQYMAGVASGLADAIKDDADAWSDHPDYDQKWST